MDVWSEKWLIIEVEGVKVSWYHNQYRSRLEGVIYGKICESG